MAEQQLAVYDSEVFPNQEQQGYPSLVTLQSKDHILHCTPLHVAAEKGALNVVEYLIHRQVDLDAGDSHEVRPLHLAAITNRLDIVQLLIDKGANPTKQDQHGDVPLHWAATKGLEQMLELLLDRGAAVDAPDRDGWTALHRTAFAGHVDACRLLLRRGASLHAMTKDCRTPLHLAAAQNHLGVMELLLALGAATHFRDSRGATAVDLCLHDAARQLIQQKERLGRPPGEGGGGNNSSRPASSTGPGDTAAAAAAARGGAKRQADGQLGHSAVGPAPAAISRVPVMPRFKPAQNTNLDADGFPVALEQQVKELQPSGSTELDKDTQLLLVAGPNDGPADFQSQVAAVHQIASEISSRSSLYGYTATPRQQQDSNPTAAAARTSLGGSFQSSKQLSSRVLRTSGSLGRNAEIPPGLQQQSPVKGMSPGTATRQLDSQAKPDGANKRFLHKYGLHKAGLFAP
eukprot:gene6986-7199_t